MTKMGSHDLGDAMGGEWRRTRGKKNDGGGEPTSPFRISDVHEECNSEGRSPGHAARPREAAIARGA